jgi:hypothetical protein
MLVRPSRTSFEATQNNMEDDGYMEILYHGLGINADIRE